MFMCVVTSGCEKGGGDTPLMSLVSESSIMSWMSGVETTLQGSMDWRRRLLLLASAEPASSALSSPTLDLQFFLKITGR